MCCVASRNNIPTVWIDSLPDTRDLRWPHTGLVDIVVVRNILGASRHAFSMVCTWQQQALPSGLLQFYWMATHSMKISHPLLFLAVQ